MDHHNRTKRLVSLGLCITLSLVIVFGSINSLSFTPPDDAFAADMDDMGGDSNQDGDSGDGDKENKGDDSPDMPKDAPIATDALTAGGDSDNDDDNDDNSGDNRDNDDDNNNDKDPTIEDAPATTDAITTVWRSDYCLDQPKVLSIQISTRYNSETFTLLDLLTHQNPLADTLRCKT
jgi:hypothetical protein